MTYVDLPRALNVFKVVDFEKGFANILRHCHKNQKYIIHNFFKNVSGSTYTFIKKNLFLFLTIYSYGSLPLTKFKKCIHEY